MARKPQPAAPVASVTPITSGAPVRWTDEEWQLIAKHILATGSSTDPASIDVAQIKAKDVFLAQDVLPEPRRRKLISIQQGFDVSRTRLRAQLDALAPSNTKESAAGSRGADKPARSAHPVHPAPAAKGAGDPGDNGRPQPRNKVNQRHRVPADEGTPAAEGPVAAPAETRNPMPSQAAITPAQENQPDEPLKPAQVASNASADRPVPAPDNAPPFASASVRTQPDTSEEQSTQRPDFVELARPFVAMVCEELAAALVRALGASASTDMLKAAVSGATADRATGRRENKRPRHAVPGEGNEQDAFATAKAPERVNIDPDDDQAETDVQPLFDPKLPPHPNSSFRPRIALAASRPDDLADLQQRFPQFELIAVTLDELRSNPVLRTCQRIVGLREDVPVAADEYLRRTFGSRYFRANGGVAKLREQLQSWLNNPSVGSGDMFRPHKPANGKGGGQKKRQFRRPRP